MGFCFFKFLILHSCGLPVETIVRHSYYSQTQASTLGGGLRISFPKEIPEDIWRSPGAVKIGCHTGMALKIQYVFVKLNSLFISQHTCLRLNPGFSENIKVCFSIINNSHGHLKCIYKVTHNCLFVVYKQLITIASQWLSALDPWW